MTSYPGSSLAFSQVREDPDIDRDVVLRVAAEAGRPVRVLLVASGGCTALSLLACEAVSEIVAVDVNPAQLHLVELRLRALEHLSLPEQLELMGAAPSGRSERRQALYARLRAHLSPACRQHWDERASEIGYGAGRVGRFEELFRILRSALERADLDPMRRKDAGDDPRWHDVFRRVFDRGALIERFGEAAVTYSMDRGFDEHFAAVFAAALKRWSPSENYFLLQALDDRYAPDLGALPPYLEPEVQESVRRLGTRRLELVCGEFRAALATRSRADQFDVVQTSNISDWMPVSELRRLFTEVSGALARPGAVIGRRLNGDHCLADLMEEVFDVDRDWNRTLVERDRSFFYSEVVVGRARAAEASPRPAD
jgi:S-adenosylmethionine-diacylglycerol 3-amino-3-carboxypropyl transferase